jgi:hypothetical protein
MSKSATNHVYGMKKEEEVKMLRNLGFLLKKLLNIFSPADSKYYETLQQMYHEQYEDAGNKGEDPGQETRVRWNPLVFNRSMIRMRHIG